MRKTRRVNKRRKYSSLRKRKSRRIIMKGGSGLNATCAQIGISPVARFANTDNVTLLRLFTFGTKLQMKAWLDLLELCRTKNVPVYILTSGNKIGIIRTLQLMNLQWYFEDVLCVHPNKSVNPDNRTNSSHDFHDKTKYTVIRQIIDEKKVPGEQDPNGYFLDDDESNNENSSLCPSIEFKDVYNPEGKPTDFDWKQIHENLIYKLSVERLQLTPINEHDGDYNFTPIPTITNITSEVANGTVKVLFLDWDKTFQIHPDAIPFQDEMTERTFGKKGLIYKDY